MSGGPLRLALTGDSIVMRRLVTREDPLLRPLFDLIRDADAAFTNLEVLPNDHRGDPAVESGGSHFAAPAWVLDELREAGFNLFAAATNHCLDYGISGLLATIEALEARGLRFAGIGRHLEEARRPAYLDGPKGTVALLSCCSTFAKGQEAGPQTAAMQGRPGLAPLRQEVLHRVTPGQMAVLREVAEGLGMEAFRRYKISLGFGFPLPDPEALPIGDLVFAPGERVELVSTPKGRDVEEVARWVREARLVSDVVVVSLHAHEQDGEAERPAGFIRPFAHRMIKEGADLVVGHGPHLLRGIEIHRGKPIFYSLGNFVGQNELVAKLPADSHERFRADLSLTPAAVYRQRTDDDRKGFPSDPRYWETVVPVCTFRDGRFEGAALHPVSLGLGEPRHRRGRPRLARGEEGAAILSRLADLSAPFGTSLDLSGPVGRLVP